MKNKFELEFTMKTSARVLFPRLSTPSGLAEWFSDNVMIKGSIYSFIWDGVSQDAEQTHIRENQLVRYEWLDDEDGSYFEFKLKTDELTGDLALIITDFAEDDEKTDGTSLWEAQIASLKQAIGL
jgi:uncharacterized protein YndB with AHSA1/START domain